MSNLLKNESSPYLLQHAENPVHWYPWGEAAFKKALEEDKPIFLSIGYSSCHWCHVMAHESFEDEEVAEILNRHFVSIKVDKEERPDIDSVYMAACVEFTGSGGWPASIFMASDGKPFFAGTYFPKTGRHGAMGFIELLEFINDKWERQRELLFTASRELMGLMSRRAGSVSAAAADNLPQKALEQLKGSFDESSGGFGRAPKFPMAHNLMFLLQQYQKQKDSDALHMAELTLQKMYCGGLFDHIGYGFCRYSTDRRFLVPHFEKMLYDNALLIMAYCRAYDVTGNNLYLKVAEKTAAYILREMTSPEGGFYSAQDADSEGEEGKYYVFSPEETLKLLGSRDGDDFNRCFDISERGNFEGKSIPNLLHSGPEQAAVFDRFLPKLRQYRRLRTTLHTDDKILTAWNGLMIAAMCALYRSSQMDKYLDAAKAAMGFIEEKLCPDGRLHVSWRRGRLGAEAFLDDYAACILALISLYEISYEKSLLRRARELLKQAVESFWDKDEGGFFLYGKEQERLITRPKECYDGAMPSGNSVMAYCLVRLQLIAPDEETQELMKKQLRYMAAQAGSYPAGHTMFLMALSDELEPPMCITAVKGGDELEMLPFLVPSGCAVRVLEEETEQYRRLHGQSSFYVCKNHSCLPPVNWQELLGMIR